MSKSWFASDYHFDHKNILKYDKRPFDSVEEMNEEIISNHNALVSDDDDVYFLGDFCFSNKAEDYLKQLKGNLYFIRGNHDNSDIIRLYKKYGTYLGDFKEIRVNGTNITLCHYAMKVWNKSHYGAWHLYGHSHGSLPDDINSNSFDVGVNCHDYKPLEYSDVKAIMAKKEFKPIDHHK